MILLILHYKFLILVLHIFHLLLLIFCLLFFLLLLIMFHIWVIRFLQVLPLIKHLLIKRIVLKVYPSGLLLLFVLLLFFSLHPPLLKVFHYLLLAFELIFRANINKTITVTTSAISVIPLDIFLLLFFIFFILSD